VFLTLPDRRRNEKRKKRMKKKGTLITSVLVILLLVSLRPMIEPCGWDAAGDDTTTMPLKICISADHDHRLATGRLLCAALEDNPCTTRDLHAS